MLQSSVQRRRAEIELDVEANRSDPLSLEAGALNRAGREECK
jgi:hypothetical protein